MLLNESKLIAILFGVFGGFLIITEASIILKLCAIIFLVNCCLRVNEEFAFDCLSGLFFYCAVSFFYANIMLLLFALLNLYCSFLAKKEELKKKTFLNECNDDEAEYFMPDFPKKEEDACQLLF